MLKKKTIKKKYVPNSKEKYMCAKHKKFFTEELIKWRKDIIKSNNLGNFLNSSDDNMSSADFVDQASSYTEKTVEMKALNRSRKLIDKIYCISKMLCRIFCYHWFYLGLLYFVFKKRGFR